MPEKPVDLWDDVRVPSVQVCLRGHPPFLNVIILAPDGVREVMRYTREPTKDELIDAGFDAEASAEES